VQQGWRTRGAGRTARASKSRMFGSGGRIPSQSIQVALDRGAGRIVLIAQTHQPKGGLQHGRLYHGGCALATLSNVAGERGSVLQDGGTWRKKLLGLCGILQGKVAGGLGRPQVLQRLAQQLQAAIQAPVDGHR